MRSISFSTRPHVFNSFVRLNRKFNWLELFFQSLANDDVEVSKTQRIFTKIDSKLDSLDFMETSISYCGKLVCTFQIREAAGCLQKFFKICVLKNLLRISQEKSCVRAPF